MKNEQTYVTPELSLLDLTSEGVLCASSDIEDMNFEFGSWL